MDHNVDQRGEVTVIGLEGPVDVSQALELRELLGTKVSEPGAMILVDLGGVTLLDSSGIGVLVGAHRRAAEAGSSFALAAPNETVAKVFALTRTDKLLRIFPSVDTGLSGLNG